jgi:hypothetical protein
MFQFFRFVALADASTLDVVADIEVLHPSDPRGILLLTNLDLEGSTTLSEIAVLIHRSRSTANELVSQMGRSDSS